MTEPGAMEPFETRLAGRIRAYTDPATERPVDTLAISRTAMSSQRATGRSQDRPRPGLLGPRFADARWAVALVAVVLMGLVGVAVIGRLSDSSVSPQPTPAISSTPSPTASAGGPIPDVLHHSWQRPAPVFPGLDKWGTGFLSLASSPIDFGTEPGAGASRSAISVAGPDTLTFTASVETQGCAVGAVGIYQWSLDGKGTVLTLTAIGSDGCSAREDALAGDWVRSDLAVPNGGGVTLAPGTYATSAFDPVGDPAAPVRLSYTVPAGWTIEDDRTATATLGLHRPTDAAAGQPPNDSFVALLAQPRMAADTDPGVACGPADDAPGIGGSVHDLEAAILARPGVISRPPVAVTIGGHEGTLLDLQLAPSWTGGCRAPDGPVVGVLILHQAGSATGPVIGLGRDHPVRLILLDLTEGRTMAIAIYDVGTSPPSLFDAHVAEAMPIVESFVFHPPTP